MYTEASSPRKVGEVARLLSVDLLPTDPGGNCFELWYHMWGSTMGTLNVYQNDGTETLIWSNAVGKDDMWYVARKTLKNINVQFQVGFSKLGNSTFTPHTHLRTSNTGGCKF